MDILGLNNNTGDADSVYINHSSQQKRWLSAGNPVEVSSFLVDPSTIKTGWGMYDGEYHYEWDEKPGVQIDQPTPDFKRAFSVYIWIPKVGTKLWQRHTWGEGQGFNLLCGTFWNDIANAKPGEVPYVDYLGAKNENFKIGSSSIPQFRLREWVQRPDDFVIPTYDRSTPKEPENDGLNDYPFPKPKPKQMFDDAEPVKTQSAPVSNNDLPF